MRSQQAFDLIQKTIDRLPKTYIIVDALDECQDREALLKFLRHLCSFNPSKLHLLATSRECDITKRLSANVTCAMNIQSAVVDKDIEVYIDHLLENDDQLQKWREVSVRGIGAFEYIKSGLMLKANGMWV